jgi:hypothetical protein
MESGTFWGRLRRERHEIRCLDRQGQPEPSVSWSRLPQFVPLSEACMRRSSACCLAESLGWRPRSLPLARATAMPSRVRIRSRSTSRARRPLPAGNRGPDALLATAGGAFSVSGPATSRRAGSRSAAGPAKMLCDPVCLRTWSPIGVQPR